MTTAGYWEIERSVTTDSVVVKHLPSRKSRYIGLWIPSTKFLLDWRIKRAMRSILKEIDRERTIDDRIVKSLADIVTSEWGIDE